MGASKWKIKEQGIRSVFTISEKRKKNAVQALDIKSFLQLFFSVERDANFIN